MTEEISKENSIEMLLLNEEICRKHVKELRKDIPIFTGAFFEARRYGAGEVAERMKVAAEKAKAFAEERASHYRMHSDRLLEALQRDLNYVQIEGLIQFRMETLRAITQAKAHRKEIIED